MKTKNMKTKIATLALIAVTIMSCNNGKKTESTDKMETSEPTIEM